LEAEAFEVSKRFWFASKLGEQFAKVMWKHQKSMAKLEKNEYDLLVAGISWRGYNQKVFSQLRPQYSSHQLFQHESSHH
jgi:hypothetical protein